MGLTTAHRKNILLLGNVSKRLGHGLMFWYELSDGKNLKFGTWNVRILYRICAIKSMMGKLEKYKLDLVGVQGVRWEGEGYQRPDNYILFYGEGNVDH
jgi:hypothetical protein